MTRKLNFGCGARYAQGWDNVDFYSAGPDVQRVNLLRGLPYADNTFDAVYSSHVLEHFTNAQCSDVLGECWRVSKPGGIIRVVVPDIALSIEEYLRIRGMPDEDPLKASKYRWIMIELLDQLVRTERHGEWGRTLKELDLSDWRPVAGYIRERLGMAGTLAPGPVRPTILGKLTGLRQKVASRSIYWWLSGVKLLIPQSLRPLVFVNTSLGERHLWMYDEYGMRLQLADAGFVDVRCVSHDDSAIDGFADDHLDSNSDGSPYKSLSLYMEASRPL